MILYKSILEWDSKWLGHANYFSHHYLSGIILKAQIDSSGGHFEGLSSQFIQI